MEILVTPRTPWMAPPPPRPRRRWRRAWPILCLLPVTALPVLAAFAPSEPPACREGVDAPAHEPRPADPQVVDDGEGRDGPSARALAREGRFAEALEVANGRAQKDLATRRRWRGLLIDQHVAGGRPGEAAELLREELKERGWVGAENTRIARKLRRCERLLRELAEGSWRRPRPKRPTDPDRRKQLSETYFHRATAHMKVGNYVPGMDDYARALELDATRSTVLLKDLEPRGCYTIAWWRMLKHHSEQVERRPRDPGPLLLRAVSRLAWCVSVGPRQTKAKTQRGYTPRCLALVLDDLRTALALSPEHATAPVLVERVEAMRDEAFPPKVQPPNPHPVATCVMGRECPEPTGPCYLRRPMRLSPPPPRPLSAGKRW